MSFKLQLDVDNATVGELSALLSAARAAGVRDGDALHLGHLPQLQGRELGVRRTTAPYHRHHARGRCDRLQQPHRLHQRAAYLGRGVQGAVLRRRSGLAWIMS